jgi:hypothetical protein
LKALEYAASMDEATVGRKGPKCWLLSLRQIRKRLRQIVRSQRPVGPEKKGDDGRAQMWTRNARFRQRSEAVLIKMPGRAKFLHVFSEIFHFCRRFVVCLSKSSDYNSA